MNADAVAALRERFERLVAEYELRATQREASPSWEFAAEDIRAALAAAPLPSDTPADGLRETLVAHYVTAIECDHDAKTDTIRCVCSVWTGTPQPSVGKAVEQWADHVLAALDGPRPAGPWTGDPADYDGDEGR